MLLLAKPDENVSAATVALDAVNASVTEAAAACVESPAWLAVMLQVPAATSDSVEPLTAHTEGVVET